jgi:hypothetical protein
MLILIQIAFVLINIWMAKHHANLISDDRPIKHGWWGLLYLFLAGVVSIYEKSIPLFIFLLLGRKIVFDISLNLFRGLPTFYVSKTTTSIVDKIHNLIFGNKSEYYMFFYLILLLTLNVLFLW